MPWSPPFFDGPVRIQSVPTPRIVYADQSRIARFHREHDYGQDPMVLNFRVALTQSMATNAMWIESTPGTGDYRPVELGLGQMLMFDGANLRHGLVQNESGPSRVSFTFEPLQR